jgi:hypothetical protein
VDVPGGTGRIGALILAAFAFVWHNLFSRDSWPVRWL